MNPTYGIEEEVFIVEPTKPSVQSLYYLSKLVWRNPKRYLKHTDSNFSRRKDIFQGLMSGVEISTFVHQDPDSLVQDLKERRTELDKASEGLIVCLGHLLDYDTPTNTCALQFHVGNLDDVKQTYADLVYYLPLLSLLTANSPAVDGKYFGKSWRLANSFGVGPLRDDWTFRFQDIIFAKRTSTIELRCFDPVYDIERVALLAKAIEAIVNAKQKHPLDIDAYNRVREKVARDGYSEELEERYLQLREICDIEKHFFKVTPSDIAWKHYQKHGLANTYSALDHGYCNKKLKINEIKKTKKNVAKMATGFAAYYVPKLPYDIWKYMKEN